MAVGDSFFCRRASSVSSRRSRLAFFLFPAVCLLITAGKSADAVLFELPGGAVDCFYINVVASRMSLNG